MAVLNVVLFFVFDVVFLVEFFNSTGSVDNLLFSSVKRMANVTDIHMQVAFGGTGLKFVTAGTAYGYFFIFGVYSLFHLSCSLKVRTLIYGHIFRHGISVNCFFDVGFHILFDIKKAFKISILPIIYCLSERCAKFLSLFLIQTGGKSTNEIENDEKNA